MNEVNDILALVPDAPGWVIDWEKIETSALRDHVDAMRYTPQSVRWHAEGDVWSHTRMVCESLVSLPEYRQLPQIQRQILFIAALLHDVGKPVTTRKEGTEWVSPSHSTKGALLARHLLWMEYGMCGTSELLAMREAIVLLIKHHSFPPYALEKEGNERKMISIAASAELIPDFSLKLLYLLAKADALGRECEDKDDFTAHVDLFAELAKEHECYEEPVKFASDYTRRAYFSGSDVWPQQELFDETWGEVVMMCGLPGTGKDYWVGHNCKDMPVVSLDDIRRRYKLSPEGNQSEVASIGKEEARAYLRKHQSFVWNATNLTVDIRRQLIDLFESYGASVRLVYLETDRLTQWRRNKDREDKVPETIIDSMLSKLAIPEIHEARYVQWLCV